MLSFLTLFGAASLCSPSVRGRSALDMQRCDIVMKCDGIKGGTITFHQHCFLWEREELLLVLFLTFKGVKYVSFNAHIYIT